MMELKGLNIGCIGCGIMGGAVMRSIAKANLGINIYVSAAHYEKAESFASSLCKYASGSTEFKAVKTNTELAEKCDIIFIAVKPAFVKSVLEEIKGSFTQKKILVSMAAGLTLASLTDACNGENLSAPESAFVEPRIMRIMPNLPAVFGESMTALCIGKNVEESDVSLVKGLLSAAGKVEQVTEKMMDGVTAVSGSGPAYVFMFIEALADAAVKFGIPRKQAYIYAAQTVKGAAMMALEDPRSISELKDAVCSPSGTTIEGVASLEKNGFRGTVIEGATAAYKRSIELGKK